MDLLEFLGIVLIVDIKVPTGEKPWCNIEF